MNISRSKALGGLAAVARRDVVKVGLGATALGLADLGPSDASAAAPCPDRGEVFAFRAPDAPALVFAVSFPVASETAADAPPPAVRLHAGSRTWAIPRTDRSPMTASGGGGALIFVGKAARPTPRGPQLHHLLVVSTPAAKLPPGETPVWAEVAGASGSRLRIGNPIVAEVLDRDPALARIFHKAHPNQDRTLFVEALAERIAARGASNGAADPEAHGRRLAAMLLPDSLFFDPRRPVGFTFAAQNGRRPSDSVADIVDTLLAGMAAPGPRHMAPFRETGAFPYFHSAVA